MANLSPEKQFEDTKAGVISAVQEYFPIVGQQHTLRLKGMDFRDRLSPDDVHGQKKARLHRRTWGVPLRADLELVDNDTGKVIDTKDNVQLLQLPKITREYTYIVRGQARSIQNQFRLKSGIFAKRRQNGQLASQFNLRKGIGFELDLNPKGHVTLAYPTGGGSKKNVNLYPILRVMGVTDDQIRSELGEKVYDVLRIKSQKDNRGAMKDLNKLYEAMTRKKPPQDAGELFSGIQDTFKATEVYEDTTKKTLGEGFKTVNGRALLLATKKLYKIAREEDEPDNLEDLGFKEIWSVEDHLPEKISNSKREILRRVGNSLDRKTDIRQIINPGVFNLPVRAFFTQDSRAHLGDQTNPLTMVSDHLQTTLMGTGGISSVHQLTPENAIIDKTHLGFLDPMHTPESKRTGVVQHLPLGVVKKGKSLFTPVWNTKTKKMELVDPIKLHTGTTVAYPDQFTWKDGKPIPAGKSVSASVDGERQTINPKKVDYILPSAGALLGPISSTVPFINHNHGARVMMADRQIAQAIPLVDREAPLVQNRLGNIPGQEHRTYEDVYGDFSAHIAPEDGEVISVSKDLITMKGASGKTHKIQLYDNYPLNDAKSGIFMDSTPIVKKGDKVKQGKTLADSNYTKGGQLALGTNLVTAYLPSGGENFEDGVVISESAAKAMTSPHLYRFTVELGADVRLDKRDFQRTFKHAMSREQFDKLDDTGIVRVGQTLGKGDTIIAALKKTPPTSASAALRKMKKVLFKPWSDKSQTWDKGVDGKVVDVVRKGKYATVYVRSNEPMKEGDKLTGRHGNKGIVVRIMPDADMPKTKDGTHVQVLMNPTTVPTRINLGQVMETAASKIAEKTGKRYEVSHFQEGGDRSDQLRAEMKAHGLEATEVLYDKDGNPLKDGEGNIARVGVGKQYILKLRHQVDKKTAVRGRDAYDINDAPKRGGKTGAQKMDSYGTYALLAHGARDLLREKFTLTSTRNDALWEAIENGTPIPTPQTSFIQKKFEGMLNGLGVNLEKRGHHLKLVPFTDQQIKSMSSGEIRKPQLMLYGDKEEPGGLFDMGVTGGVNGTKWSHFSLAEPTPNPLFAKGIRALTGLGKKDFLAVAIGEKSLKNGTVVPNETEGALTGGKALYDALSKINVKGDLAAINKQLKTTKNKQTKKTLRKKAKFLKALADENLPATTYMLKNVPVMPPKFRPIMATDDNSPFRSSLNGLYKYVGVTNAQLKENINDPLFPQEQKVELRKALLGQLWKLYGAEGRPYKSDRSLIPREDEDTLGILELIAGKKPKDGFFQDRVLSKRQDLSMRTTITVGSDLGIDEVGLPKKKALKLFEPLVKRELKRRGLSRKAQDLIDAGDKRAYDALQHIVRRQNPDGTEDFHPVVLKRDPALHKFSVMGYKVKLVDGDAIRLHPLSCEGFNADFDGDQMAAFVPVTPGAVDDAKRMLPSRNLFSATHGGVMHTPSQDAVWGLYQMSRWGKDTGKTFKNNAEVLRGLSSGQLNMNDVVTVGRIKTTPGRLKFDSMLPHAMRGGKHLTDPKFLLQKGNVRKILNRVARNHRDVYADVAQTALRVGNNYAYKSGRTVSLDDLKAVKGVRSSVLQKADKEAARIKKMKITKQERDERLIDVYNKATDEMLNKSRPGLRKQDNSLFQMNDSGARGSSAQLRQMVMAPMLVQDAHSRTRPNPIKGSYAEGLDFGSYWDTQHGARKGIVQRATGTAEPGAMSKQLINTSMHQMITDHDCGTKEGLTRRADDEKIEGRVLARDLTVGEKVFRAGTIITPTLRKNFLQGQKEVPSVHLRSPLKCEQHDGVCSKCFGSNEEGKLHELGVNVGLRAGQAVGEPLSQGAMNAFHSGGVAKGAGAQSVSMFQRVRQLVEFPKTVRGATTLASRKGLVESVTKDPTGGYTVVIGGKAHKTQGKPTVKKGQQVSKGDRLSHGVVNPHEMMQVHGPKTGIRKVRAYLTDEMTNLFGARSSLHERNIETVVRSLTDLVHVEDPGNAVGVMAGDMMSGAAINKMNSDGANIRANPILKGSNVLPLDQTQDFLARANYEKLKSTFTDAALQGWKSNIHGTHPIPALAYGKEFGRGTREKPWLY